MSNIRESRGSPKGTPVVIWGSLGSPWAPSESIWGPLGSLGAPSESQFGVPWEAFGDPQVKLHSKQKCSLIRGLALGYLGGPLGVPWRPLGSLLASLGVPWEAFGGPQVKLHSKQKCSLIRCLALVSAKGALVSARGGACICEGCSQKKHNNLLRHSQKKHNNLLRLSKNT